MKVKCSISFWESKKHIKRSQYLRCELNSLKGARTVVPSEPLPFLPLSFLKKQNFTQFDFRKAFVAFLYLLIVQ